MVLSYFKIALRHLLHNRIYSIINIAGLSLGITCCLLLSLYLQDEFSYDRHHKHLENIYRIDTQFNSDQEGFHRQGSVSPPIAMTVREEVPEVEAATRVLSAPSNAPSLIKYGDQLFYEPNGCLADSTLFDVLSYEFIVGNPAKALTEANTVVLSSTLAKKLFGDEAALDKSLLISQGGPAGGPAVNYKVTGVFRDDKKSFLEASFFTSMLSDGFGKYLLTDPGTANEWAGQNFVPSFVRLRAGHSREAVEKKINDVLVRHGAEAMKAIGFKKTLLLDPVRDIYLNSVADRSPRITYLYIIVSIASFILLLACINFMNLSTAKATQRAAEIGIRKVMGAYRSALVRQLLGEALIIVLISVLLSVVMVQLTLPVFNELAGKAISFNSTNYLFFSVALGAFWIITALIAGSYPAFYLSSFQPAEVLKGRFTLGNSTGWLRQGLVVFQFMVAIVLVCGMFVISKQLSYMKEKELGFDSHAKIILPLRTGEVRSRYDALRDELSKSPGVTSVSGAQSPPGLHIFNDMSYYTEGRNMNEAIMNRRNRIDAGYLELLGIKMIAGRTFTDNRENESKGKVIINRTSAKRFGIDPVDLIGQHLYYDWHGETSVSEVIGVMEDYHQTSLREPIEPTMFEVAEKSDRYQFLIVAVNTSQFQETITAMEKVWKSQVADTPFEFNFLDDIIQKQYDDDRRVSGIIASFTVLAMIICSLGLYGLSSYMAERRFKEIGVRKVMGASTTQIVTMMSGEFVKLVAIAFFIAVPLAWYSMNQWLEGFEYKLPLDVSPFLYAGLAAMTIALLTISFESFRAANTNPATSLRTE